MSGANHDYLALSPSDYPYLESLNVSEVIGTINPDIVLSLTFYGTGEERLLVRCAGVRDLEFKQPWTTDMKLHSLEVADVGSAQMEGIQFEVCDLEEEFLSFRSRTFEARRSSL